MNLIRWKEKNNQTSSDVSNSEFPYFGLTLFPEFKNLVSSMGNMSWNPAVDIVEEKDHYAIKADLPGLKREEIDLSLEDGVLTIKGERKYAEEKKEKNYHRIERSYGQFIRSFDLGVGVDSSKIKAKYNDGVLEITVGKSEQKQTKKIMVEDK